MNTVDKLKTIIKKRKIAVSKLEKECGFSNGYIGQLKKGSIPYERIVKISEFLEIPTSVLTGEPLNKMMKVSDAIEISDNTGISLAELVGFNIEEVDYNGAPSKFRIYEANYNHDKRHGIVNEKNLFENEEIIIERNINSSSEKRLMRYLELFNQLSTEKQESIVNLMENMK